MKMGYQMVIFFLVVVTVYTLINLYIYYHGINLIEKWPDSKIYFRFFFLFFAVSFFAGRIFEKILPGTFSTFVTFIGSFWLAYILYLTIAFIVFDLILLINYILHFWPKHSYGFIQFKAYYFVSVFIIVSAVVLIGHINARKPVIRHKLLKINKTYSRDTFRIAAVSDIHLGTLIGPKNALKLVKLVNSQNPDIILLAGDIVDEDIQPVIASNAAQCFKSFNAPKGVFAITGNHEFIGGAEQAVHYLQKCGITFLLDNMIEIDSLQIIGRIDRDSKRFSGIERKTIDNLLQSADSSKPLILLDHQPYDLDYYSHSGIDLQISGHTHHGQLWPLNYITAAIFEVSRGYKKINNLHVYVSNGYGTWGPPVRIGNRPEIVVIDLVFNNQ